MKPKDFKKITFDYVFGKRSEKQLFDNSWALAKDIKVELSNGEIITIPKGFETDFSSTPEFLWGILKPFGDFLLAPIVHDYLYRNNYKLDELGVYKARLFADREMLYISNITNSKKWYNRLDNKIRYWAVRTFGWYTYKKSIKETTS